jgi:hypothetical protein
LLADSLVKPNRINTFFWDYSYFKWQDIPVEVRREMVRDASTFGRTWITGRTSMVADVFKHDARKMYNENWDGCRDLWKESYRLRKLYRDIDRPIPAIDPIIADGERQYREWEQTRQDRFNARQQKRYERWQKRFTNLESSEGEK